MKLPCQTIEDLLPLYFDGVCSQESRALVEEHTAGCKKCRQLLVDMNVDSPVSPSPIDDAAPLKKLQRKWLKSMAKSFYKGILISCIVCILLFGLAYGLTSWKCIPVPAEVMEVSDVSLLEDGRIIYHLNVTDCRDFHFTKFTTTPEGELYVTPMRSVIEPYRFTGHRFPPNYQMLDIAETNAWQQHWGDGIEITSAYIGPVGSGILIWEKGMDLPPASEMLEEYYGFPSE